MEDDALAIPNTWRILPLMAVARENSVVNSDNRESNVLSLSYGHVVRRDISANFGLLPESFSGYQIVRAGDTVLRLTDLQNDQTSLRIGAVTESGIITSAYLALSPNNVVLSPYLYYLLHSYDTRKIFYALGGGVRQSIGFDDLKRLPVIVPPLAEQHAICQFLDDKTTAIADLIAKKERMIELLDECRQALITHGVTKGLDLGTSFSDSGDELLGWIPSHWRVQRVKHVVMFVTSGSRGWADFLSDTGAVFLQSGNLTHTMSVDFSSVERVELPAGVEGGRTRVSPADVLVCITGGRTGTVAVVDATIEEAYVNQHLALLRPASSRIDGTFLALSLASMAGQTQFERSQYGLKEGLSLQDVRDVIIAVPPLEEQHRIAVQISEKVAKVDQTVQDLRKQIELLRDCRDSLISAAVSGKCDVGSEEVVA